MTGAPYTLQHISSIVRDKSTEALRTLDYRTFQRWPAENIVAGSVIRNIIQNELDGRGAA